MEKAFGKTETNAQFFYDLLHGEEGDAVDAKIDGALPEGLPGGPVAPQVSATNSADQQLQGHEVVAAAFNRLTKYYPKITEHFQKLGLDLETMLAPDGTLKPAFVAKMRERLEGKDASAPKSALSFQSAQLMVAEREGISTRDPLFAEKFKALMEKPQADRDAELKQFFSEPKNVGKLVRWAFRFSEFSLLPFKDQVEVFKAAGFDEALVKTELAQLWQGRSLPKWVAQAALLKGMELDEAAKALEGEAAQKKQQEARFLFRAAVELDNQNPLARRRLSTHLIRENKYEGASFHLGEAVKHETEVRYLVEVAQGLAIGDKRLLGGHADPWAFVAENLVSVKRFTETGAVYHEAAKAATAKGDHAASLAFTEKELKIDEAAKPFILQFTEKQNPVASAFYKTLRAQGIPSQLIDAVNSDASKASDRKIEAAEVLAYLDANWKDPRVQAALKSINFPALPWELPGAKPPYVDTAFEKLSFADKMAAWHDYEIGEEKKKEPLDEGMLERRLRLASYYQPAKAERHQALGEFLIEKKRYSEAVTAFQAADVASGSGDLVLKTKLGHALFGTGDFKASRDMYTLGLEKNPKDLPLLKLRFEANQNFLATLDPAKDADAIKVAQAELNADGALVLALSAKDEKAKLTGLEKLLGELHDGNGDKARVIAGIAGMKADEVGGITKKDAIAAVEGLAQNYLSLAEQAYADPKDAELVRSELNTLASECFSMLSRFAAADGDPEVQRMAKVYEGYALVAQGKIDEGVAILTPLRKIPQADRILTSIEKGKMRLINLSAVETWEVYNKDLEGAETDSAKGWMSGTSASSVSEKWAKEHAIAKAVKEKLTAGEADSMEAALKLIAESGDAALKERAQYYLSTQSRANGTGPIGDLIAYASGQPPLASDAQRILAKCFDNEAKKGAVESSFALYALIHAASPEADIKKSAQGHMDGLQGKATFGRSVEKFFKMHSGEGLLVDVGLMFVAAGLGNLAKLRMLAKLEQAGVSGYKAVAIASAVGIGTEATVFWAGGTVKEAMLTDPSKVFTKEHLLKGWGSSLIMIGGLKGFGKLAEGLGPRAAKGLGLMKEGGTQMTFGGKALVWGIGHAGGLGGMIASSHVNQGLGLTPKPLGGWKEGLVNEVFGYVQFAVAHKVADGVVKGKMTEVSKVLHTEIAFKEALLVARGKVDSLGSKADRYVIKVAKDGKITANDKPLDALDSKVKEAVEAQLKKDKDGKVEAQTVLLESPERKLLVGLFLETSLNRPGFSGGKMTKLLAAKEYDKANAYLKEFNLPLHFDPQGALVTGAAGEPSPHQALGITAPESGKKEGKDAKPEKTPEPEEISDSHILPLEEGRTPAPIKLAARKVTPPPKPTRKAAEKPGAKAMTPKTPIPEGLRHGVAINLEGKPLRVDFDEHGVTRLDVSGRALSAAEGQKTPHIEIQMALADGGAVLHNIRSVGAEKLRIVDSEGNVREVTATFKPLRDGDRFRLGGTELTWFGPRSLEGLEFKTKEAIVFEGRVYLEDASKILDRREWAESFAKEQERDFIGQESMFGDPARIFANRVAKDPRMSDPIFREAFSARCKQTLETLKPVLEKLPEAQRADLAFSLLKQVIGGHMLLGDAKAMAASVAAGTLIVEPVSPEKGKAHDYLLVPAFQGVRLPPNAGMLEGADQVLALDFGRTNYQVVQLKDATLQILGGQSSSGKAPQYFAMNKGGKVPVELYDLSTKSFITLSPRVEVPIPDGTVFRVGGRSFVFRSPEWVAREMESRNKLLAERELLTVNRAEVQLLPDGNPKKATQVANLEKMEADFLEAQKASGRDRDGVSPLHAEMTHLALGETDFSGPARQALAGKLSPEQYRQAQTEIGKKLVEEHRAPLEEVSAFLKSLTKDEMRKHRFSDSHPVHARLKDPADIAPKLWRRNWTDLSPLTDVGGARVVVKTTNDVLPIVEAIEARFKVRSQVSRDGAFEMEIIGEEKSEGSGPVSVVNFKPDKDHPDRLTVGTSSGYRAMHVVVEVDGRPIEIQIQTEAIYQWGKIQHSLVYKNKNLPAEILEGINVFCREAAKYLTDLESGPKGAQRPALPLVPKNLTPELRTELNTNLQKMNALMDHYEQVAQDPGLLKTQVFRPAPVSPSVEEKSNPDGPKTTVVGRIPKRRSLAEYLAQPVGLSEQGKGAPIGPSRVGFEIPILRGQEGLLLRLPADKAVVTVGAQGGNADLGLQSPAGQVATLHAEFVRGSDGSYHLRPLEGKEVQIWNGQAWSKLRGDGKGAAHALKAGDRVRIGDFECVWELKKLPPLPVSAPKPPPLPKAKGYEHMMERDGQVGRELAHLVEVSDATLRGENGHWESSFANSTNPDSTHITIRGGWRHLSKAEYEAARIAGTLKDTAPSTYEVRILGEERLALIEARLQKKYGDRLQRLESRYPLESRWLLRNEKGETQVEMVLRAKTLKIPTPAEAREIYQAFSKEQLPTLDKWLDEESSMRGFYAFRMSQMLGVEGDGKGNYRLGRRFVETLRRFETAQDSKTRNQVGEELAVMVAYLQDAKLLVPEYRLIHAATYLRDISAAGKAVTYALRGEGELKARGEVVHRAFEDLRRLSDRVRSLGEELRRDVTREAQKPGNQVYDEYLQALRDLRKAVKIVNDLEMDLTKSGVDLATAVPSPKFEAQDVAQEVTDSMILEVESGSGPKAPLEKKRDLHGAEDQPLRDLRIFSETELEALQDLGVGNVAELRHASDPKFAQHLVNVLAHLMNHPYKSREYESGVLRLVGALRHWELFGGHKIEWLDGYLRKQGRNSYGVLLQSMPTPMPPPVSIPLSREEREDLGVRELRADNVMQVISEIRSRSTQLEGIGDFIPFRPSSADRAVLRRIMDNYGATVTAANPKLGMYLLEIFRPREAYIAPLDAKGEGGPGGKLPKRLVTQAKAVPESSFDALGEPTGAYVEKIPLGGLGKDLKSLAGPRPSFVGEIQGITPALEKIFDRGGRIEDWPSGRMLVEAPSGAETRIVRPASPSEVLAYLRWSQRQGFVRIEPAHAQAAWRQLEGRAKDLGIELFLGEDAATGRPEGKKLEEFLGENGGQIVAINSWLQKLPKSLLAGGGLKRIFLKSPRQENAHFGAYDAADGSLYLYSGAFHGSRRNLAALFLHEVGHPTAERYRTDSKGDGKIPLRDRQKMQQAHQTLVSERALFAIDWGAGKKERTKRQAEDSEEFISDLHIAYVATGPALRAHIRSLPLGSPAREAWDFVYGELRDRVFGGMEYDFAKLPPPPPPKPGLRVIPGGKADRPATAIQVPEAYLKAEMGPQNAVKEMRLGGLAAGRDPGVGRYAHNEDRYVVVRFQTPEGKEVTRYFAIDGMGGHEGGEFAALFCEYVLKEASRHPSLSIEEAIRLADRKMLEHPEYKRLKGDPGAVVAGVETRALSGEVYEVRFADVGDAEAMIFRPDFELQENAYTAKQLASSQKLARGHTVLARIHPFANQVDQAVGGHYPEGKKELRISVETHRAKKGSIVVAGSDGFTENFISKDEIGDVLRFSGARNAAEMELALRNEALLRMHLLADFKAEGRFGQKISHQDFVAAYRKVWKQEPPAGAWRYEGMTLTERGHVVDMAKDKDRDGLKAHFVGHFKSDNITVIVHRLGEELGEGPQGGVRADFRPPPLPRVFELDATLLEAESAGH